jgi:hypothetical protein
MSPCFKGISSKIWRILLHRKFPMELVWFLGLEDMGVFVHNALYANFIGVFSLV